MKTVALLVLITVSWSQVDLVAQPQARPRVRQAAKERRDNLRSERLTNDGIALVQQGKKKEAAEKFQEALRLNPENGRAHAFAAQLALDQDLMVVARNHALQALRFQPDNARAHFVLAQILMREGKALAASDHLRKASRNAPEGNERTDAIDALKRLRTDHPEWFRNLQASRDTTSPAIEMPDTQQIEKPSLAVFPFAEPDTTAGEALGVTLSEMLTTALINGGAYRIIERRQLNHVFEEQALGQSGALEAETAVAVGQILGVSAVVVGNLSHLPSAYEADARILSIATGEALSACNARGSSSAQFRDMAETLAAAISAKATAIRQIAASDSASVKEN